MQWQHADITIATREAGSAALYNSYQDALKGVQCKALIMPTRTDQYFTVRLFDHVLMCKLLTNT
jgi:hypothetical protein